MPEEKKKRKKGVRSLLLHNSTVKKRGQVFTFASSLTLFDKGKKKGVRSLLLHSHLRKEKDIHSV
jgi:hypothetical protein